MDADPSHEAATSGRHRRAASRRSLWRRVPPLVLIGRTTLALIPILWAVAYLTRPIWIDAQTPDNFPTQPLAITFFVLSLTIGSFTPLLFLPIGAASQVTVDPAGVLTVVTVPGRLRLDLNQLARVGALTVYGRAGLDQYALYLRGARFRWVLVALGPRRQLPSPLRERIETTAAERPELLTARARTMLRLGLRPGRTHRFALGLFAFIVGYAAFAASVILAWTVILVEWAPYS